jgi:arylsulfate sulfotransferase
MQDWCASNAQIAHRRNGKRGQEQTSTSKKIGFAFAPSGFCCVPAHVPEPARNATRAVNLFAFLIALVSPAILPAADNTVTAGTPTRPSLPITTVPQSASVPSFSVSASPTVLQLVPGGAEEPLSISTVAGAGFKGTISVKAVRVPAGIQIRPASLVLAPGANQPIEISATSVARAGTYTMQFAASSGALTENASISVKVSTAVTTAALSTFFYDFGNDFVGYKLINTVAVITNTGATTLSMNPVLSGDTSFSIVTERSCGTDLAVGKSCDMAVRYVPTQGSYPRSQNATLAMHFANATPGTPETIAITGVSAALKPGTVTPTNNPQVALYTMTLPFPGRIRIHFGPTKSYGMETWYQNTEVNNGQVSIYVAGMKASTAYHMAAEVEIPNILTMDEDHTFTTQALPAQWQLKLKATTTADMTPQPGIEFVDPETPVNGLAAIDLEGNIIWTYTPPGTPTANLDGAKMLPNGDILLVLAPLSNKPLGHPNLAQETNVINEIREINLAGDTVKELSIADLDAELLSAPASCNECQNLTVETFHHDVTPLPNGHWLLLTSTAKVLGPGTTPKLTNLPQQPVDGDVIIDVDENLQPVWAWSEFNHLDPNRHPYMFPDWTHTNAILYSPDDRNIIISIRHQNWVIKVNYDDGEGNGDILWRLGEGGDFKLIGGDDPVDWQYAQHGPGFFSPNTSGVFSLGLMDNGDDRLYPSGSKCTPQASLPASCLYSTIPIFRINENKDVMTATLTFHQKMPADMYSFFGGNTYELPNGHVEYDLCGVGQTSDVMEVTQDHDPKTVWSLKLTGGNFYRAFRVPSLYPNVQW